MRRFFTLLLVSMIILSFICSVNAESFTLHSGTMFGMTDEEVFDLEEQNGFSRKESESYGSSVSGKIAGYDDSTVYYGFNSDGKLVSVSYKIGETSNSSRYNVVYETLAKKYGTPRNDLVVFKNVGADNIMFSFYSLLSSLLRCTIKEANQWIISTDGGYVCITCMFFYANAQPSTTEVWISYEYITEENYNATITEKDAEMNQIIDDL